MRFLLYQNKVKVEDVITEALYGWRYSGELYSKTKILIITGIGSPKDVGKYI